MKINQNENPFDVPEAFKRRVLELALSRPWSRYPSSTRTELVERAGEVLRLAAPTASWPATARTS